MLEKADDTLAKKTRRSRKRNSTGSTNSAPAANSASPKDVLALGRQIADHLELASGDDVVAHWLAHHVAELIDQVDHADPSAKQAAQDRAVETILKLWAHRRALPEPADPLSGLRLAIDVLGRMSPKADPWARSRAQPIPSILSFEPVLSDIFQTLSRTVVGGLFLTLNARLRPPSNIEAAMLGEEEDELLEQLSDWIDYVSRKPRVPAIQVRLVRSAPHGEQAAVDVDADDGEDELIVVGGPQAHQAIEEAPGSESSGEAEYQAAVLSNLKEARDQIDHLIDRWERSVTDAVRDDDDEDY